MRCAAFCKLTDRFLFNPFWSALLLFGLSALALGGAYFSQFVLGMLPCSLCLLQRIPHSLIVVTSLIALFLERRGKAKPAAFMIFLCGLFALSGAAIASYHVGVEQHWWTSFLEACAADFSSGDLLATIEKTAAVRCDVVPWSLFGISMAGYNALLSAGMAVYAVAASILITRRTNGLS